MSLPVVVIPTYDERENVAPMSAAVLAALPSAAVLFVDDSSPDGTGEAVDALAAVDPRIRCLHRRTKDGLGRAYVAGFDVAISMGATDIVQMDCDFSHDPADLPRLLASGADLAIGSRYVRGGATPGWPLSRRLVSRLGGAFVRAVTGMPVRDPTGGFKRWRVSALERTGFRSAMSSGYSFQLEMNHRAWKAGLSIEELPISFSDRARGYSKITAGIAAESVRVALSLARWRKGA